MELRKRKTREEKNRMLIMESDEEVHLNIEGPVDEDLEALTACLETLKSEQKQCVSLFYLEKKSYREVESETGLTLKTVKSAIQNGKRNLKICIEAKLKVLNE